jgi:hypothetical protein
MYQYNNLHRYDGWLGTYSVLTLQYSELERARYLLFLLSSLWTSPPALNTSLELSPQENFLES